MKRTLVAACLLFFVTVACGAGGSSSGGKAIVIAAPTYPTGWSELDVSASHFKLGLPDAWPYVRVNAKYREADLAAASKRSGTTATVFQGALAVSTGYALLAAKPDISALLITATIAASTSDKVDKVASDFVKGFSDSSGGNYTQGATTNRKIAVGAAIQTKGTISSGNTTLDVLIVTYLEPTSQRPRTAFSFVFLTNNLATYSPNFDTILDTFRTV